MTVTCLVYLQDNSSNFVVFGCFRFLVGAPKGNITDRDASPEVKNINQPGVVYSCPLTSYTNDCESIKIDRHGK